MTELTTTVQCDCGQKIFVQLKTRRQVENPHGLSIHDIEGKSLCTLFVTDGKLVETKEPVVAGYKFVCNKCLEEK